MVKCEECAYRLEKQRKVIKQERYSAKDSVKNHSVWKNTKHKETEYICGKDPVHIPIPPNHRCGSGKES